jgi:hypothetical protein
MSTQRSGIANGTLIRDIRSRVGDESFRLDGPR